MTNVGEVPAFVLENAARRLAVGIRARNRPCVRDGCDQPATHSPCSGAPACDTHRTRPVPPVSDPARRIYALRARAIAERQHLETEQLLTVRINYVWVRAQRDQAAAA